MSDFSRRDRMVQLINRLLDEAPKMEGAPANDPGAIQAQIILRSGFSALGALTIDREIGMLKFLVIGTPRGTDTPIACEYYFDFEDLEAVVVMKAKIAADDKPRIYTGQT